MDTPNIEQLKTLSPEVLYSRFIERVVELEAIWGLYHEKREGWAVTVGEDKVERLVLWSESHYAKMNAEEAWKTYGAETMDIYGFVENGIDELKEQGRSVSIMYLPEVGGLEADLDYLKRDLEEALVKAYPELEDSSLDEED